MTESSYRGMGISLTCTCLTVWPETSIAILAGVPAPHNERQKAMDGDDHDVAYCDELARVVDAKLLIDEAHPTFVMGAHARGAAEFLGLETLERTLRPLRSRTEKNDWGPGIVASLAPRLIAEIPSGLGIKPDDTA